MSLTIRNMQPGDIEAAYRVASFALADDPNDVLARSDDEVEARKALYRRGLETDPDGSFVAVDGGDGGDVVGVSRALMREGLWLLSLLVVNGEYRGAGVGKRLIEAALGYGGDFSEGMIASSTHPAAMRTYANAGFTLHPTFTAKGKVQTENIPPDRGVRESDGGFSDMELADRVSRHLRGAAHGKDLEIPLSAASRMLVADSDFDGGEGYAVYQRDNLWLLGATTEDAAARLLWAYLARCDADARLEVRWITARQDWAVRIVLAAGLDLVPDGPICVKGDPGPLTPYLPSGPFL